MLFVIALLLTSAYEIWASLHVEYINSLTPERCGNAFKCINFNHNIEIDIFSIQVDIALEWIPKDIVDDNSEMIQVMAWISIHRVFGRHTVLLGLNAIGEMLQAKHKYP